MSGHSNGEILERIAVLETEMKRTNTRLDKIDGNMTSLNAYANKGKGAIATICAVWSFLCLFVGAGISYWLSK